MGVERLFKSFLARNGASILMACDFCGLAPNPFLICHLSFVSGSFPRALDTESILPNDRSPFPLPA
jgi:hypothetical protein